MLLAPSTITCLQYFILAQLLLLLSYCVAKLPEYLLIYLSFQFYFGFFFLPFANVYIFSHSKKS